MAAPVVLESLDLAALLCSRICHDLISPVGAVVNGMEVLEETNDEGTKQFALDLIKSSANQASNALKFCRIAFGAAGSAGAEIDLGDAESVARGFFENDKTKLSWNLTRIYMPKNRVKLLLNLILLANGMIPRGGTIKVDPIGEGPTQGFRIAVAGSHSKVNAHAQHLLAGESDEPISAHAVQPFYAGLLLKSCGLTATIEQQDDAIVVTAS